MIMNMNEKGRQTKLLAAIAVLAMVVCAFAVVMPSDVSGEVPTTATAPTGDFADAKNIGSIEDLEKLDAYKDGVLTVPEAGLTLNLTADIGNPSNPIDMKIVLDGNLKITSAEDKSIYIQATGEKAYTVTFNKTDTIFAVEGANVTLDANGATSSVINNMYPNNMDGTVMVTGGANLTIKHTSGGSTWLDSNQSGHYSLLYVKDSTVNFDDVHAIQSIDILADTATIYANASENTTITGYFNLTKTTLTGTNIGMYAAKLVDSDVTANVFGVYSGATTPDAAEAYGSSVYTVNTISMDKDSSVTAKKIINDLSIAGSSARNSTINFSSAGTVSGELTGVKDGDTQTTGTYKFTGINADGVTLGANAKIHEESTYAAGTTGATAEVAPAGGQTTVNNTDISTAFTNGAAKVEVSTGTISGEVTGITGQLSLGSNVTIAPAENGTPKVTFTLGDNGSITRDFNGDDFNVTYGDKTAKFLDFSGDVEITTGSVTVIGGEGGIDSGLIVANNVTVKIYGEITGDLTIKKEGTGTVKIQDAEGNPQTLTIAEGANLTMDGFGNWPIEAGMTLKIEGSITGANTTNPSETFVINTVDNDGTIVTYPTTNLNDVTLSGNVQYETDNIAYEFKGMLDQDFTVSTEQSLTGDLWIPDGVTLTVASGGVLNMAGYGIYVQGTLDVQANGAIKNIGTGADGTVFGKGTILLHRDGEILNEGVIGSGSQVTVSADIRTKNITDQTDDAAYGGLFANTDLRVNYNGVGSVIMQNVEGVSFDIVNSNSVRYLTITGDVNSYGGNSPNTVSATDVRIAGELTIGDDVVFTADGVTVTSSAIVNVDGNLKTTGNGFIMTYNSTVNVDGQVDGLITAQTGDFVSKDGIGNTTTTVNLAAINHVTGIVLTVGQVAYVDDNTAKTKQILYISGNLDVLETGNYTEAKMVINNANGGLSYVAEGDVLDVDEYVEVDGGNTVVEGQVVYIDENNEKPINFNGTQYTIEGASGEDDVGYITTFEAAYAQIANAKDTTIVILGDMTIEIDVNLTSKQTIDLNDNQVKIDTDATVEVQRGGTIDGKIYDVQGVLISYNGGGVTAPQNYAVYKKTTEYTQWSGLIPAINNAVAGDVIDVKNPATVEDDMTIPAGVTVNNQSVLTFEEDLVIAETAVLNNEGGKIQMIGEKSTITVDGTLDSGEGTVNFMNKNAGPDAGTNPYVSATSKGADDSRSMTSVGSSVIGTGSNVNMFISAAYYTNEDGYTEYTTVAKAVAAAEAMEYNVTNVVVVGTLNQSDDITLAAGTTLTIDNNAKVTLGKVTLTAGANGATGAKVISNGQLTATVAGATGVVGSTSESTVELSKAALTAEMVSNTDNQNVTSDYLVISGNASGTPVTYAPVKGTVTVATGTVNAGTIEFDGKNTLTVAAGATLAVEKIGANAAELIVGNNEEKASVTVEGTIVFADDGELTMDTDSIMDVNGTMTVADETDVSVAGTLNVAGTLAVSTTEDKEASVAIPAGGVLAVEGTVTGAVDTVDGSPVGGYIKAYVGADLSNAIINMVAGAEESQAESTAFYINGELYMTVYSVDVDALDTALVDEKFELAGVVTKIPGTTTDPTPVLDINYVTYWYTDAELSEEADDNAVLGNPEALYFKAPAATAEVTISVGSGISIYIDDVRYDSGRTVTLAVGTHSVTATVNPGFTGTVNVTFAGQVVTNGQFEITADMASAAYDGVLAISATGDITQDSTVVIDGGNAGSDMGLTDYLLIILVILIVIMAIIVALRLMRS